MERIENEEGEFPSVSFRCEICKKEFGLEGNALKCEARHKCQHKWGKIQIKGIPEDYGAHLVDEFLISRSCQECKLTQSRTVEGEHLIEKIGADLFLNILLDDPLLGRG